MDEKRLSDAIKSIVGKRLAHDITADFFNLRRDVATGTLERASAGKFVESFVQCLQQISCGCHSTTPIVDTYLNSRVENDTRLPDGLRLCGSRVARSIYTMRNKRNIAHKGEVDPNRIDLEFTYHGAVWIMAELIRCATGITMEEAGGLIRTVSAPVGTLVEEIDGVVLVHAKVPMRLEILLILHSRHPDSVTLVQLVDWIGKSSSATRSRLIELRKERLIIGENKTGFKLTSPGYALAVREIQHLHTLNDSGRENKR